MLAGDDDAVGVLGTRWLGMREGLGDCEGSEESCQDLALIGEAGFACDGRAGLERCLSRGPRVVAVAGKLVDDRRCGASFFGTVQDHDVDLIPGSASVELVRGRDAHAVQDRVGLTATSW